MKIWISIRRKESEKKRILGDSSKKKKRQAIWENEICKNHKQRYVKTNLSYNVNSAIERERNQDIDIECKKSERGYISEEEAQR